jgi:hypothetical protein
MLIAFLYLNFLGYPVYRPCSVVGYPTNLFFWFFLQVNKLCFIFFLSFSFFKYLQVNKLECCVTSLNVVTSSEWCTES